jgi:hypothetical protein
MKKTSNSSSSMSSSLSSSKISTGKRIAKKSQSKSVITTPPAPVMISNLCEEEKQKVTRLVEDLLILGQKNEELKSAMIQEQVAHETEIKRLQHQLEGNISIIEDQMKLKDDKFLALETKESLIIGILALYQEKMKKMSDIVRDFTKSDSNQKNRITMLEKENEQCKVLIENQQITISNRWK